MLELGKFSLKLNFIPNRLEKYMSFNINHILVFTDSFIDSFTRQFIKKLSKSNFKYLSQEFGNN